MKLTKQAAVALFGGKLKGLAEGLGVTPSAVSQWPDELRPDQADRVIGAAVRLGLIRTCEPASEGASVQDQAA